MRKFWIAAAALCLLAAVPAGAQNRRASGELGIFGGYRFFDADIDDDFTYGVHFGVNITDSAEIEVRYEKIETEIDGTSFDVDLDSFSVGFTYNYHPGGSLRSPHVPYFGVGIGTGEFDVGSGAVSVQDDFDFFFLAAGHRVFWNEDFAFRWDVRTLFYGEDGDLFETDQSDFQVSLGIAWVFGGG